ncbi:hypothetical protein BJ875DRAFT_432962 [Amylocarpus encephaloides]|uniref:F-box domain-containing protein n=1 Tax=Amylocarpus encephaloides TaxID=45428 RepID=A0A9P7YAC3_9HELO|nr:hypothetical protein BJ875DRAFT_432962 [Amylocarpus encephaloides]
MDSLPQELIDLIVSYLHVDALNNTLTLSRKFCLATERESRVWECIVIDDTGVAMFLQTYCSKYRFQHLNSLLYLTNLPPLRASRKTRESRKSGGDCEPSDCRDTREELRGMDEAFSHQIFCLFTALKKLEEQIGKEYYTGRVDLRIYTPSREIRDGLCLHLKFVCWRIHLLSPELLPELSVIRTLEFTQESFTGSVCEETERTSAKIDPRVILDMAAKLPKLEYLRCDLWEDGWDTDKESDGIKHYTREWEGPRRDARQHFANALLATVLPPSLKEMMLGFEGLFSKPEHIDHRQSLPNLIKPAPYDLFSSSLRILSYRLRKLQLFVVADETLFWPVDGSEPSWPNLERLNVMFHMVTPKGGWYFQGLNGEGKTTEGFDISNASYPPLGKDDTDSKWDGDYPDKMDMMDWSQEGSGHFRIVPHDELLSPFLTAFAKAAARMPLLRKAVLWTPLYFSDWDEFGEDEIRELTRFPEQNLSWGVVYVAPGKRSFHTIQEHIGPYRPYSDHRRLWWKVGKWRPNPELHDLFQRIGRHRAPEKLIEYWEDHYHGQGLVKYDVLASCSLF